MNTNSHSSGASPLEHIPESIERLTQEIVTFHDKKVSAMRNQMNEGRLETLGMSSSSSGPYMSVEESTVQIGLFGLSALLRSQDMNFQQHFDELEKLLISVKDRIRPLSDSSSRAVRLSQTPRRSGAYMHFLDQATAPYDYANLTPYDDAEQLRHEDVLHTILDGGAIYRRFIPRPELRSMREDQNLVEFKAVLRELMKRVAFFQILPGSKPFL